MSALFQIPIWQVLKALKEDLYIKLNFRALQQIIQYFIASKLLTIINMNCCLHIQICNYRCIPICVLYITYLVCIIINNNIGTYYLYIANT